MAGFFKSLGLLRRNILSKTDHRSRVMMSLVHDDVCHLFSVCVSLAVDRTAHQFLLTARGEAFYSVIVTHPA